MVESVQGFIWFGRLCLVAEVSFACIRTYTFIPSGPFVSFYVGIILEWLSYDEDKVLICIFSFATFYNGLLFC